MIHGGGFMTLSKTAVRPYQTQYLLDNGYLPVSVDYRLCPEIDLIAGPMTDVRDALGWVRQKLPAIALDRGFTVDPTKIIAVGWSTGGHLAMTTAWTCAEIGEEPPSAVLSFYGPTNFESECSSPFASFLRYSNTNYWTITNRFPRYRSEACRTVRGENHVL